MKKITGLLICILLQHFTSNAQSFAVNTTGAAANGSAILDVSSNTKGLLIPRMTRTERNAIATPATGLLIFQSGPDSIGYYYYSGSSWTWLLSNATADLLAWRTGGNAGTIDGSHFMGTTDNIPLTIKVNNQRSGRIDHLLANSFWGYQAGNNTSSGVGNTANGYTTLFTNTSGNNNTAMGRQALYFNTTGASNTAIGYAASINNTVGSNNTANGFYALYNNVAGSNATAVGYQSMLYTNNTSTAFTNNNVALGFESLRGSTTPANNTGNWNTALGYQTLWSNTIGNWNTAAGESALYSNTTGVSNTALGETALYSNTSGYSNTAVGRYTLWNNNTGYNNTAIGMQALLNNTSGFLNTATGQFALGSNTTGTNNTANGATALSFNTTGIANTAVGFSALQNNVTGSKATAIGYQAMLYSNNSSTAFTNYNVAVGFEALRGSTTPATNTGNNNTALGYQTLWSNTTGDHNNAVGYLALYSNTFGDLNTAIGDSALYSNTGGFRNISIGYNTLKSNIGGFENTAIGTYAMYQNTNGAYNTATGAGTLSYNTTGENNSAYGFGSLDSNTTGAYNAAFGSYSMFSNDFGTSNTAIGYSALINNISGSNNSASGYNSLFNNTVGQGNTAMGNSSLLNNVIGNYNTAMGYSAGPNSAGFSNSTAIGYNALVSASNAIQFGNNAVTDVYAGIGNIATLHSGYAIIERSLTIDHQDQNGSANTYILKFGAGATGEGIGSNRTTAVNQWGLDFYTGATNRMCIGLNGNVGIGITSPASKLDVNGQITIDQKNFGGYAGLLVKGNSSVSNYPNIGFSTQNTAATDVISVVIGGTITNNTAGSESMDLGFYTSTSGLAGLAERLVIKDNGNVGIGITNPNAKLNITGSETTANGLGVGLQLTNTASTNSWTLRAGATGTMTPAGGFSIGDNSLYRLVITSTGNVGIGTTLPNAVLSVNGAANNSTGAWGVFSDERIKTIMDDFTDGLNVINQINPVKFRYNENAPFKSDDEQIGIVAQDLEKIAPYMVSQKPYKEFKDLREVNNQAYVFLLINAVKEQQQQIEAQQKENVGQKQRIDNLEKMVKELSRKVNL